MFNDQSYKQTDGVTITWTLSLFLADVILVILARSPFTNPVLQLFIYSLNAGETFIAQPRETDINSTPSIFNNQHPIIQSTLKCRITITFCFWTSLWLIVLTVFSSRAFIIDLHFQGAKLIRRKRNLVKCPTERAHRISSGDCLNFATNSIQEVSKVNG